MCNLATTRFLNSLHHMQKAYNICNVTLRKIYVVSIFYIYIKQMN